MQIIPSLIPYEEDELFFSWFYRLAMHNYAINIHDFANNYLCNGKFADTRHPRKIKYDFRENISQFQSALNISDSDCIELFHRTSIFNAISPFMNEFNRNLYYYLGIGKITRDDEKILLKILQNISEEIHLCPKCMEEEIKEKGFFWHHRAHQLPNVKVCYKHHCVLKVFSGRQGKEFDANYYSDIVAQIDEVDSRYTIFCKEFLDQNITANINHINKIIQEQCVEIRGDKRNYQALNEKIKHSEYKNIFPQNPSIFISRTEEEGTYIDPVLGLPLLFFLFENVEGIKKKLVKVPEVNTKSNEDFKKELEVLLQVGKSKKIIATSTLNPQMNIEEEIYSFVGDEYELVSTYVDRVTKVQFKHKKCEQIFIMKPMNFFDGGRCPFCKVVINQQLFKKIVLEKSNGRYKVRGRASRNLWIIYDVVSKQDILLNTQKTMQELNKKNCSYILPIDTNRDNNVPILTRDDEIYQWIQQNYSSESIIFLEDINIPNCTYSELKERVRNLRNSGKLILISPGIYHFPGTHFTQDDLFINHYLIRKGEHIGYYYGKTLGEQLGLCEKNETIHIVSNQESQRHGRKKQIYGKQIRIKGPVVKVTEDNYRILAMLDFITCYNTYTKQGKEPVLKAMKAYVNEHGIKQQQVNQYIKFFPIWTTNFVNEIF